MDPLLEHKGRRVFELENAAFNARLLLMTESKPRYISATAALPGNAAFWQLTLDQSDLFAYHTAKKGKGGPFGAQLWLVRPETEKYVLAGTASAPADSNAVISKGRASAHAEAENLSPGKRQQIAEFLKQHRGENWHIVQISSGESCPSCRSKQVLFASELIEQGLLKEGNFHVIFKATYQQTKLVAGFNDAPYDEAFRAIVRLKVLEGKDGLTSLENLLQSDPASRSLIASGSLIYNKVRGVEGGHLPDSARELFSSAGQRPAAIIISPDGQVMATGLDSRKDSGLNMPEKTAIVAALYAAAASQKEQGKFESWDLAGARLYTNIFDIGPLAYSESLWYNLSDIYVATDFTSDAVDQKARELPCLENRELFARVAAEYNDPAAPVSVTYSGTPEEISVAHQLWAAKMAMEQLKIRQALRLQQLGDVQIEFLNGDSEALSNLIDTTTNSSHYDGKQAVDPASG